MLVSFYLVIVIVKLNTIFLQIWPASSIVICIHIAIGSYFQLSLSLPDS